MVEAWIDAEQWDELDHLENNSELNEKNITQTAEPKVSQCMRPANIDRNHRGSE
jgi:hypothetical protein